MTPTHDPEDPWGARSGALPTSQEVQTQTAMITDWVDWYVDHYEAWAQIPACWEQHAAMVNELEAAKELRQVLDAANASDLLAGAKGRAEWHDYRGRMMERLTHTPGLACAERGKHHEPVTWDHGAWTEKRKQARLAARQAAS